jgi:hypothetical protein
MPAAPQPWQRSMRPTSPRSSAAKTRSRCDSSMDLEPFPESTCQHFGARQVSG